MSALSISKFLEETSKILSFSHDIYICMLVWGLNLEKDNAVPENHN